MTQHTADEDGTELQDDSFELDLGIKQRDIAPIYTQPIQTGDTLELEEF